MEVLFRRHASRLFGLAYRVMGREDDIEDIVQDAFVEGFERLSKLEDPDAFASWIATIVVRQAHRRIRRRRLLARLGILNDARVDADAIASSMANPERALELRGIYSAFDEMSAEMRVAIVLHRIERLSLDETAATMGVSIATVKRRIAEGEAIVRARVSAGGRA
jgi:RNA polymerase sigma-70 factor (ECF subfamily)